MPAVIPIFIDRMLKKLPVTINGGYQTRDFIYIDDVINAMSKLMSKRQKKKDFKIFNLGTGRSVKIEALFNIIKKKLKVNPRIIRKKLEKFETIGELDFTHLIISDGNIRILELAGVIVQDPGVIQYADQEGTKKIQLEKA